MDTIAAIETAYGGCMFRSRLEARWAVFFDELGIEWQYESQGFEATSGMTGVLHRYLPDFFLPHVHHWHGGPNGHGVYVEVKGTDESLHRDSEKIGCCIDWGSTPVSRGLLILGDLPRADLDGLMGITHTLCYWRSGVRAAQVEWRDNQRIGWNLLHWHISDYFNSDDACTDRLPSQATTNAIEWSSWEARTKSGTFSYKAKPEFRALRNAYRAARSARFEHGERGAIKSRPLPSWLDPDLMPDYKSF